MKNVQFYPGCFTYVSHLKGGPKVKHPSITAIRRKKALKGSGNYPILIQIILDRKKAVFHTGLEVTPTQWDDDHQRFTRDFPAFKKANSSLNKIISDLYELAYQSIYIGEPLTAKRLRELYLEGETAHSFYTFFENHLQEQWRKNIISTSTYRQQKSTLAKLKLYQQDANFMQIDEDFIKGFQGWMRLNSQKATTIQTAMKNLKKFIGLANKKGYRTGILAKDLKVSKPKGNRVALDYDEYLKVREYYRSTFITPGVKRALQWFLLGCNTGLRLQDLRVLKHKNLQNNSLMIVPKKTIRHGKVLNVPLLKSANEFISPEPEPVLPPMADQVINRHLKTACGILNIRKTVSMHVARHTFAYLWLYADGSIQQLKEMLGHSDIRETMTYISTFRKDLKIQRDKMDDLLGE